MIRYKKFLIASGGSCESICNKVGIKLISLCSSLGSIVIFISKILFSLISKPRYLHNLWRNLLAIGFFSIPIIGLTCLFSGAVLVLQTYTSFTRFSNEASIAAVVSLSITRELAPVMCGLMVSGRVGAAMAAEIATMRVTEQIDALFTLSTNPIRYLVTPQVIASVIALPLLVLIGDAIGLLGGYVVSIYTLNFNSANYIANTLLHIKLADINSGLIKAIVFGLVISLVSCYSGYYSAKGARGVGSSTTRAVVTSSILILVSNYLITAIMF